MLSLDVTGAFDHASHLRLIYILKSKWIPLWIINWVTSFLEDGQATIKIHSQESALRDVKTGIPQGSPISPILFLFYNEELIRLCNEPGTKSSGVGFVDDVNILAWNTKTEANCRTLLRIHDKCQDWARRHGASFAPSKYDLIHLSRYPKTFNMGARILLDGTNIAPKTAVRVLGLIVDSKLSWHPHIKKVEDKMAQQTTALTRIAASTWGATFMKSRTVFSAVIRPVMTYASQIWYNPEGKEQTKETLLKPLRIIQNRCLRTVSRAYRATPIPVLEVETGIEPIHLHLAGLQANYQNRRKNQPTTKLVHKAKERIKGH